MNTKKQMKANKEAILNLNEIVEDLPPTILTDSIITGLLKAKNHQVTAELDDSGRVSFRVFGNVKKSLNEIYANQPVGALDAYQGIKSCRSLLFSMKGAGK